MRDFYLDRENRKEYIIVMLEILKEKYHVDITRVSNAIGIAPNYMYDLMRHARNPLHETMDRIEVFINDLYEPIVRDEIGLNRTYFEELSEKSQEE